MGVLSVSSHLSQSGLFDKLKFFELLKIHSTIFISNSHWTWLNPFPLVLLLVLLLTGFLRHRQIATPTRQANIISRLHTVISTIHVSSMPNIKFSVGSKNRKRVDLIWKLFLWLQWLTLTFCGYWFVWSIWAMINTVAKQLRMNAKSIRMTCKIAASMLWVFDSSDLWEDWSGFSWQEHK